MCILNKHCLLFLTAAVFLNSCTVLSWDSLSVSVSPGANEVFYEGDAVTADFSIQPEHTSVEKAITLKVQNKTVQTIFSWSDSCCCIKPVTGWQKGADYKFLLDGTITTADGRKYTAYESRNFRFGEKGNTLTIETCEPESNTLSEKKSCIRFTFNKPVVQTSFLENFSLSPYEQTSVSFSDDNRTATVEPVSSWPLNTILTWSVGQITAEDGYILDSSHSGFFRTMADTEQPEIIKICPVHKNTDGTFTWDENASLNTLREKQPVGIIFSKEMDFGSVENGISFKPALKGYFTKGSSDGTRFVYVPYEMYQIKKQYQMTVSTSVTDIYGLPLYNDTQTFFTSENTYLCINSIKTEDGTELTARQSPPAVKLPDSGIITATILFSTAITNNECRLQTEKAVSPSVVFPSTASIPSVLSVRWNIAGTGLIIEMTNFSKKGADNIPFYYELKCTGSANGAVNSSGEYMEEDTCVVFTVF